MQRNPTLRYLISATPSQTSPSNQMIVMIAIQLRRTIDRTVTIASSFPAAEFLLLVDEVAETVA